MPHRPLAAGERVAAVALYPHDVAAFQDGAGNAGEEGARDAAADGTPLGVGARARLGARARGPWRRKQVLRPGAVADFQCHYLTPGAPVPGYGTGGGDSDGGGGGGGGGARRRYVQNVFLEADAWLAHGFTAARDPGGGSFSLAEGPLLRSLRPWMAAFKAEADDQ